MNLFRRYWQVIYAIVLMVAVPFLIVANTIFVVDGFKRDTDVALQRQALSVGRMFNLAARDSLGDPSKLQSLVDETVKQVGEVSALEVLRPDGQALPSERFKITAASDKAVLGSPSSQVQNVLAWTQDEAFAFLTLSDNPSSADQELQRVSSTRYWAVVMPLHDPDGKIQALLYMKFSLATFDALVAATLLRSYLLLAMIVLVTVLVLASNTRLFQYAMLFRKLKEVDKMKDEFISMASHELMTPISAIKGFLSLFLENAFGPFQGVAREKMQTLFVLSDRLGELVEDLLNVSRIEQGRVKIDAIPTDPSAIVGQVMEELENLARSKDLAFKFVAPDQKLPDIMVDPPRLKQVLVNIIGNAVKYTPRGSVTVTAYLEDGLVKIKCTDTGLGMSPTARERLFQKFYRIKTEATSAIPGSGLGLWITKQLVELQKGKIYVDSIEDVGTQMTVAFPAEIGKGA